MSDEMHAAAKGNAEKESRLETLKTWLPLVTSLVTAVFGFVIWNAQASIQERVDKSNRLLEQQKDMQLAQYQTQLALQENYYKRRLEVYEKACQQITETEKSLADVGVTDETLKRATDVVSALDRFRKGNQLYWSPQLDQRLDGLWTLSIDKLKFYGRPEAEELNEEIGRKINREIAELHAQMKRDLDVPGMSKAFHGSDKDSQEEGKGQQAAK